MLKKQLIKAAPFIDILLIPLVFISALILKAYRTFGSKKLAANTRMLKAIGIFPILKHYYQPLFDDKELQHSLRQERQLPGLEFNITEQNSLLKKLRYQKEFDEFCTQQKDLPNELKFNLDNGSFKSGDAEFLFNFIRHIKPKRVIEIGCGNSTKLIAAALRLNKEFESIDSVHTCIEPYQRSWLENFPGIDVVRSKVENCDLAWNEELQDGDFLFIDSSHMIRPQGDVLYEYLTIIPQLKKGVYVHVHDIFTPYDYLDQWIREDVRFWNEQYLLEATLSSNNRYQIVAQLNYLHHTNFNELQKVCPYLTPNREPGSFYFKIRNQ